MTRAPVRSLGQVHESAIGVHLLISVKREAGRAARSVGAAALAGTAMAATAAATTAARPITVRIASAPFPGGCWRAAEL